MRMRLSVARRLESLCLLSVADLLVHRPLRRRSRSLMQIVAEKAQQRDEALRERRDIVSGEVLPENRLLRFVAGPDGAVVPDVAAKLPGRGLWVEPTRAAIARAEGREM